MYCFESHCWVAERESVVCYGEEGVGPGERSSQGGDVVHVAAHELDAVGRLTLRGRRGGIASFSADAT